MNDNTEDQPVLTGRQKGEQEVVRRWGLTLGESLDAAITARGRGEAEAKKRFG